MIGFATRLVLKSGRESLLRFLVTGFAIGLGVMLLLTAIAGTNAVSKQNRRVAWVYSSDHNVKPNVDESMTDPLYWRIDTESYRNKLIARVDVAATGARSPVPPGISALPSDGEMYASPSLLKLIQSVPRDQLADRFPSRIAGTIDTAALPTDDTLLAIVGHRVDSFPNDDITTQLRSFETAAAVSGKPHDGGTAGFNSGRVDFVVYIVAVALLFPIAVFVASSTRLAAARREERLAAMRLVGATPKQITIFSAVEAVLVGLFGVVAGFVAFYVFHDALASAPVIGTAVHGEDLQLTWLNALVVATTVPAAAASIATATMARVRVSPFGVVRRARNKRPSAWRLTILGAGIVELALVVVVGVPSTSRGQQLVFLPGMLLLLIGLVVAGPWITGRMASFLVRFSNRADVLLSGRRLSDDPSAAFRAVSGIVLAVFTGTAAFVVVNTMADYHGQSGKQTQRGSTVYAREFYAGGLPSAVDLSRLDGVTGSAVLHRVPTSDSTDPMRMWNDPTVIACSDLARVPALGTCIPGAKVATVSFDPGGSIIDRSSQASMVWPSSSVSTEELATLPVSTILVATDGSIAAKERVKTALWAAYPTADVSGIGDWPTHVMMEQQQYQQLANVIIVVGLFVAGCTLAVSLASGIIERQRAFALLRLTGVSLRELRRIVLFETAAPLVAAVLLAVVVGLLGSSLFLKAQLHETLRPPTLSYYLALGGGLIASLCIMCGALPLLGRATSTESARNE